MLDAAIRIARAEDAVLVPAYLLVVPLAVRRGVAAAGAGRASRCRCSRRSSSRRLRAGVPVDARIEKGRTLTHALQRLWDVEHFDRIVAPAPTNGTAASAEKQLAWLLTNAPAETLIRAEAGGPAARRLSSVLRKS